MPFCTTSTTSAVLDYETYDTSPSAIVTEIGCVIIRITGSEAVITDKFYLRPDILGQLADGRTFSKDTLQWHMRNGSSYTLPGDISIADATRRLHDFLKLHDPRRIWAWGKDFERPLYENLCKSAAIPLPAYQFRKFACARDKWQDAFGLEMKAPERTHNALQDCLDETRDLIAALNRLNLFHAL